MLSQLRELLVTQLKTDLPVREYGLIQAAREHIPSFPKQPLADPHVLFQSHFLIRHAVYCLRNEWRACQHAELTISPLYFEKTLWQAGLVDIVRYDGVAAFYLDFANLERITAQEVSWLLSGFWDKYAAYHARQQLCQLLDLPSDCTE
ncbi:MAG TPA: DNA-J related domain-containing protein, partial [Pseudomonadales bacterium]|nr:DNA-J related domain-containing protein [Pseudomonadales bacterium]